MNENHAIPADIFIRGLLSAAERVRGARDELGALDATAGDGDLGATLYAGFGQVITRLQEERPSDPGKALASVGAELARSAPSTSGALLATAFIRAAVGLAGVSQVTERDLATMLRASATAVAERGGAAAGERTMLDAMLGGAEAANAAASARRSAAEVLAAAARGAEQSANATAHMEPKHGRALWVKERAQGQRDAGAVAWAMILAGLADGVHLRNRNL